MRKGHYTQAKVINDPDGSMVLDLPEVSEEELRKTLPPVSVITITRNRAVFAGVMLYNWSKIKYPRDKLEWVIVDDSDDGNDLAEFLPDDPNVHYHKLDRWYPVAEKRNKAVELAHYDIIVFQDDDDFMFSDHVLAKVRVMQHYKKEGVHSMPVGIYDMMEQSSFILDLKHDTNDIAEATLAFTRRYWKKHPFASDQKNGMGEGRAFVGRNFDKFANLNFMFSGIAVTHTKNITNHNRRFINERQQQVKTGDFRDIFPAGFNLVLENIRKILIKDYVQPDIEPYDPRFPH